MLKAHFSVPKVRPLSVQQQAPSGAEKALEDQSYPDIERLQTAW